MLLRLTALRARDVDGMLLMQIREGGVSKCGSAGLWTSVAGRTERKGEADQVRKGRGNKM